MKLLRFCSTLLLLSIAVPVAAQGDDFDHRIEVSSGEYVDIYARPRSGAQNPGANPAFLICQDRSSHTQAIVVWVTSTGYVMKKGGCLTVLGSTVYFAPRGSSGTQTIPADKVMVFKVKIISA